MKDKAREGKEEKKKTIIIIQDSELTRNYVM